MTDVQTLNPTRDDFAALLDESLGGKDLHEGAVVDYCHTPSGSKVQDSLGGESTACSGTTSRLAPRASARS